MDNVRTESALSCAALAHIGRLAEAPVLQIVQNQGRRDVVERVVGEGERAAHLGHPQVRLLTERPPGTSSIPVLLSMR
jgi:hypothetical protein